MFSHAASVLSWNDEYATGIRAMDEDHRHLFRLIDECVVVLRSDKNRDVAAWKDEFNQYAAGHFVMEESLMEEFLPDWQGRPPHIREHRQYWMRVMDAQAWQHRREMADFLLHWWSQHVLDCDRRLGQALRDLPLGDEQR